MRLLLDTHVWIWSLQDPARLSRRVASALTDRHNELWLSPISVWEFLLLVERGRIAIQGETDARGWIDAAFGRVPLKEAPVTREVVVLSRYLSLGHEDAADRFLGATAAVYDLTLVSADDRLLRSKDFRTLANR